MRGRTSALYSHGAKKMVEKLPRERLRDIRERSGVKGAEIARVLGYANASGYFRFESEAQQGNRAIPYELIKRLIPVLRGKGDPAITAEELLRLTDAKDIPKPVQAAFASVVSDGDGLLAVRYRVEKGVFVRLSADRSYGASRIGTSSRYPREAQFAAAVGETEDPGLPNGSQLQCVSVDSLPVHQLHGKRVLVGVPEAEGIVEVKIGRVGTDGSPYGFDGMPLSGPILGVVIGTFVPE